VRIIADGVGVPDTEYLIVHMLKLVEEFDRFRGFVSHERRSEAVMR
jgi:hypothetical protein